MGIVKETMRMEEVKTRQICIGGKEIPLEYFSRSLYMIFVLGLIFFSYYLGQITMLEQQKFVIYLAGGADYGNGTRQSCRLYYTPSQTLAWNCSNYAVPITNFSGFAKTPLNLNTT